MNVGISVGDWDSALSAKSILDDIFLVLLLQHVVLRAPTEVTEKYHVVSPMVSRALTLYLCKQEGPQQESWQWLGDLKRW